MNDKKKTFISDALLGIALMFTIFFFSPAEMFFLYKKEFIIEGKDIIPVLLLTAAAASIVNFVFLRLCGFIKPAVHKAAELTELGLLAAFYIQLIFLNGKMVFIGSDQTVYLDDTKLITQNTLTVFLIFILPISIWLLAKKYDKNTVLVTAAKNMTVYLSALIFVMQLCGFANVVISTSKYSHTTDYGSYFSYKPLMSLSKEKNIVVFLVDKLDGAWFEIFLNDHPDLAQTLEGFTYYGNNISEYSYTFPSVVSMLTSSKYDYIKDEETYMHEAWQKRSMADELKTAGYEVDMMLNRPQSYMSIDDIKPKCDNIFSTDSMVKIDHGEILKTMTDISLGKVMPYLLKPIFIDKYTAGFSARFVVYNNMPDDYSLRTSSIERDMDYYNYFKKYGLDANSEKKKFMFVHLNGTHDPSPEMSMLYPGYTEGMPVDLESTTMGVFTMLGQYFDEMKKLGVFDNSTIIIIADHGCPPYEYNVYHQDRMEKARLTTLLIKPENSPALPLAVDADSELSNGNFAASVLEYAGIDTEEYGNSYNDIIKNDLHWDRYMQTHDVKENIIKKALYVVRGSARDFDNWYVESE